MGNTSSNSCCSVGFWNKSKSKTAMIFYTTGNIRQVNLPLNSAELMIDEPGHVIAPVDELHRTQRISALGADEELQPGKAYMLIPASRLHSKASPFEIAITEEWAYCDNNKKRRNMPSENLSKVSPSPMDKVNVFTGNVTTTGTRTPCASQPFPNHRRWNPVLDTILESTCKF